MSNLKLSDEQIIDCFNKHKSKDDCMHTMSLGDALIGLGFNLSVQEMNNFVKQIDADGFGKIDLHTFVSVIQRKQRDLQAYRQILAEFKKHDHQSTGQVSVEKLRKICEILGPKMSEVELDEIVEELNTNGVVQYSEFCKKFLKYL